MAEDSAKYIAKKGYQSPDLTEMPDKRCLGCSTVCETCADVCPNRANVAIKVAGKCQEQVIHVDGMCNECGNCAVHTLEDLTKINLHYSGVKKISQTAKMKDSTVKKTEKSIFVLMVK